MIKIAVASGKGGTGKTTIATSLMQTAPKGNNILLDCDVEAPNAHIALKPESLSTEPVHKLIPQIDRNLCTYCGKCAQECRYNAISVFNHKALAQQNILVFPNLCHACGVCSAVCPEKAITEIKHQIGTINFGNLPDGGGKFANGELKIGSALATPIIENLKKKYLNEPWDIVILDSPPGASCAVVETLKNTDFVILVTEPTPFGLHDLLIAIQLVKNMGIKAGIVINRDGIGNIDLEKISKEQNLPILMRIPMKKEIAQHLANGESLVGAFPEYYEKFNQLHSKINQLITIGELS